MSELDVKFADVMTELITERLADWEAIGPLYRNIMEKSAVEGALKLKEMS